jgi:tryptophan-rich sensory protein
MMGNSMTTPNALQQGIGLAVSVFACFAAAGLGSIATTSSIPTWYADLAKPAWTPPDWIFGPVWTLLYSMMAIAAWLVWRRTGLAGAKLPLGLFAVQLVLNTLWSILFFGLRSPGGAMIEIVLLWAAILATLIAFWRRSRLAGGLLVPYLAWVSFAAVLNAAIWWLGAA